MVNKNTEGEGARKIVAGERSARGGAAQLVKGLVAGRVLGGLGRNNNKGRSPKTAEEYHNEDIAAERSHKRSEASADAAHRRAIEFAEYGHGSAKEGRTVKTVKHGKNGIELHYEPHKTSGSKQQAKPGGTRAKAAAKPIAKSPAPKQPKLATTTVPVKKSKPAAKSGNTNINLDQPV